MRLRNFIFTLNNPTSKDKKQLINLTKHKHFQFLIFQKEIGEVKKTPHFQGYFEFKQKIGLKAVKKVVERIHVDDRRGTQQHAIKYVTKEKGRLAGPWTVGQKKSPGKRTDIMEFKEVCKKKVKKSTLLKDHLPIMARYPQLWLTLQTEFVYKELKEQIYKKGRLVFVKWGPTGSGKTRAVYDKYGLDNIYRLVQGCGSSNSLWFDGYCGQEVLLLDDFYGWIKWHFFLSLLDRYPLKVQIKGGTVEFVSPIIEITSNQPPEDWYMWTEKRLYATLKRRLTKIIFFPGKL